MGHWDFQWKYPDLGVSPRQFMKTQKPPAAVLYDLRVPDIKDIQLWEGMVSTSVPSGISYGLETAGAAS
jgi:hypothetical protein